MLETCSEGAWGRIFQTETQQKSCKRLYLRSGNQEEAWEAGAEEDADMSVLPSVLRQLWWGMMDAQKRNQLA